MGYVFKVIVCLVIVWLYLSINILDHKLTQLLKLSEKIK